MATKKKKKRQPHWEDHFEPNRRRGEKRLKKTSPQHRMPDPEKDPLYDAQFLGERARKFARSFDRPISEAAKRESEKRQLRDWGGTRSPSKEPKEKGKLVKLSDKKKKPKKMRSKFESKPKAKPPKKKPSKKRTAPKRKPAKKRKR